MNINARGLKKLLCNPTAQRVAGSGDPVLVGMFEAAGQVWGKVVDEKLRGQFLLTVTEAEAQYLRDREEARVMCQGKMQAAFDKLLEGLG